MAVMIKPVARKARVMALALSLALPLFALPAAAQEQAEGVRFRDNEAAGNIGGNNEARRAPGSAPDGGWTRPARVDVQRPAPSAAAPAWNRSAPRTEGNGRSWENRGGRGWSGSEASRSGYRDAERRDSYRSDGYRSDDRRWNRRDDRRTPDRSWNNHTYRYAYGHNRDQRRWDNRWRDNRRYDWYSYRRSYPGTFRLGGYYSPYRNYSYRRLNVGFFLNSLFYSNRYWINDPWQYRLPDAYGPYRWIRYYDDALLVNIHTGQVVDVVHSFFW